MFLHVMGGFSSKSLVGKAVNKKYRGVEAPGRPRATVSGLPRGNSGNYELTVTKLPQLPVFSSDASACAPYGLTTPVVA